MIRDYDRRVMQGIGRRLRSALAQFPEPPNDVELAADLRDVLKEPVNPNVVGKWRRGEQEPTIAELQALADVLQVRRAWLAFGEA